MYVRGNVFPFCERRALEIHLSSVRHKSSENLKGEHNTKDESISYYLSVLPAQ